MIHRHRKVSASVGAYGALLAGILGQAPARAAWELVPSLTMNAQTDENPRLDPVTQVTDTAAASSGILWGTANITTINERNFLTFEPSVISYQYFDESNSDLESTDWLLNASGQHRWQKVQVGFASNFSDERLLSSELVAVDPDRNPDTDGPDNPDSGRLAFIDGQRERYWLNPYLGINVSERNSVRLDATKDRVSYDEGDLSFRSGYVNTRLAAAINRNVDERNIVSATMSVEKFEADATQNATDTVTIEGAFIRPVTELWTFNLAAGVLRSDFEFVDNQQLVARATTDYTMRLGLRKRSERSRINLDFTRDIYPSTSGYSSIRREVLAYYNRNLRQRLGMTFGVRVNETESLGDVAVEDNRKYWRAEVGFEWAMKPVLFLGAGYSFTAQDFTEDLIRDKTESNSVFIGISYRGLPKH